jgi:hypothetical protein
VLHYVAILVLFTKGTGQMKKFNIETLGEAINAWVKGTLSEKEQIAFFNFVWDRWNNKTNVNELDLSWEFMLFTKGA